MLSVTINKRSKRGFTLVELLIVIAILAMLAAAVVIVLNPAEMLAQARDAQRMSDMAVLRNALTLHITQGPLAATNPLGTCPLSGRATFNPGTGNGPFATATIATGDISTSNVVIGTGWVNVDLGATSGGSPIPFLPLDPTNNATYFYAYACHNPSHTFEFNTRLESARHRSRMVADGGNRNTCSTFIENTCFYELGTDPGLDL